MVASADNQLSYIKTSVRRLTASPSTTTLPESDLETYIQNFYTNDLPDSIKTDQLQYVYTFLTSPNIDRYSVDINTYQGFKAPLYVEGTQGTFYKDRATFFNAWPNNSEKTIGDTGDGSTTSFTITNSNAPFLSQLVVIGTTDSNDAVVRITDDGDGTLYLWNDPTGTSKTSVGTVDYVSGSISIEFPVAPKADTDIVVWTAPYNASRPFSINYWNNEITVRPVPDGVYKIEVDCYRSPTEFLSDTSTPTVTDWSQYIIVGVAMRIMRDRGDMEGYNSLMPIFMKEEAMALERQGVAMIGIPNNTIYNTAENYGPWANGGWYS